LKNSPGDVTLETIGSNCLFTLGWDMGTHGGHPFQGIELYDEPARVRSGRVFIVLGRCHGAQMILQLVR
jgi:hypothetical protein